MLLDLSIVLSSIIPAIIFTYIFRINYKRKESKKILIHITLLTIYVLFIIRFDKLVVQLYITSLYSLILYLLLKIEIKKIKKERNEAMLDRMEVSYQKYATIQKRRKI